MRIAVVGGTGSFGRALAVRLREAGEDVIVGSRDHGRAQAVAAELGVAGSANEEAVRAADLVVLAVKADALLETAGELAEAIGSTPVLCVGSELAFSKDGVRPAPQPTSLAERVAERLDAPVAAGLHSLAAANLGAAEPPDEDAFVCADDPTAKELALELASKLVSGRALDAGPLAGARTLEGLTAVIVNLNRRYKAHAGMRVTGLP
ncbi:MAG: NADPH-dependent F420 reductase [Gaiellaceae bacterium]